MPQRSMSSAPLPEWPKVARNIVEQLWREDERVRAEGERHAVAKHAGPHLEKCVACELKLVERVGRIPVCVSLLPECGCHGVGLLSVELRADNHQGSLPAPSVVGELKEQSTSKQQARAEAASCTAILSCWAAALSV